MQSNERPVKMQFEFWQFVTSLVVLAVSVVVFTFGTFATKSEVEAAAKADEKIQNIVRDDIREIKQDVKELLKNSKR